MRKHRIKECPSLFGEVSPPGDKSISHRAIILNSIADGASRVINPSLGADCLATVNCLRDLGIDIEGPISDISPTFLIPDKGREDFREPTTILDAKNSGTTIRLLTGLLSTMPFLSIITGDESLRSRPMDRVIEPLRLMGAQIWGRSSDSLAPLAIRGAYLKGIEYRLPISSAQLKSAITIAALFADGPTILEEPSISRDHTEKLLEMMGNGPKKEGQRITITPGPLKALDVRVPGDISSAAYWLVAGAIHPNAQIKILNTGVNPTRTGIIDVLQAMGANLKIENQRYEGNEPVADLHIQSSQLVGTEVAGELIPRLIDEIPLIALAASQAQGTTIIRDAAELRIKESDRIAAPVRELGRLGVHIEELPDGMVIHGGEPLTGDRCYSYNDHRLAMTLGIAGLIARGETVIEGTEVVDVSYPSFWEDLRKLTPPQFSLVETG